MYRYYTGIGSRQIPPDIARDMTQFAYIAARKGWILRSGGATGADSAFEKGCDDAKGRKEIFLPWPKFNGSDSPFVTPSQEAHTLASTIHPCYKRLTFGMRELIARNMHQVLGEKLDSPTEFVVCWTPDGARTRSEYSIKTGGTGSAIVLASDKNIPVFNLYHKDQYIDAIEYLLYQTHYTNQENI